MKTVIQTIALAVAVAGLALAGLQQGAAQPAQPAAKMPTVKSPAEGQALQSIVQAVTPDARITAAEEFTTKYPDSDFKALVLSYEAQSYQQKNDPDKTIIYGERALDAHPDPGTKVQTMLMLARTQAQLTREFDLDRDEKLGKAEKNANGAIEMLNTMAKPNPQLPDEQWNTVKADFLADAHDTLGVIALVRKNYPQAIEEFKTAMATAKTPDVTTQVRLADAYNKTGKYDDALAVCDKVLADPNLHPAIKRVAQSERDRAAKGKNGGPKAPAAPANPPAPGAAPGPTPSPAPAPAKP